MIGNLPISWDEFVYAAILALCITVIIKNILMVRRVLKNARNLAQNGQSLDISNIMTRCYTLFPIDEIVFKGIKYTRGMKIKITTNANTDFEGEFIGGNEKNMLCIKTSKYIIAHELKDISTISIIDN